MNLFELFGEAVPEEPKFDEKKAKKKETKAKKEDSSSKTKSGNQKKEISFKSPLSLFIGADPHCYILEKDGEISISDVKTFAASTVSGYPADITSVFNGKDYAVVYLSGSGTAKGTLEVSEGCRMFYGSVEFDISELVSEGGSIEIKDLLDITKDTIPVDGILFVYSKEANLISIQLPNQHEKEVSSSKGIIDILYENGERAPIEILSDQDQLSQMTLPGLESEEDKAKKVKNVKVELSSWLKEEGKVHPHLGLVKTTEKGLYLLGCCVPSSGNAPAPKEVLYSTENSVLSLLWNRYELTPELFGGKTEVSVEELLSYLVSQGNREFEWLGKNDVSFQWNAKNRCILVSLKGSRKGADIAPFFLPEKIPYSLAAQWVYFSTMIYDKYRSEVLMDLYFDPKTHDFLWYVPKQKVSGASVFASFETFLQSSLCGLKKIGQFHSHGTYPAFFSPTDDADEVIPGIYGVIGNIRQEKLTFKFRLIDRDGGKKVLAYDELFSSERTVAPEAISSWQDQVSEWTRGEHAFEHPSSEYPLATFGNGLQGLLLSCSSEADFMRHIDGFHIIERELNGNTVYFAVPGNDAVPSDDFMFEGGTGSLFELY